MDAESVDVPSMESVRGRPSFDRMVLYGAITAAPRRGRRMVRIDERRLAADLGWHRSTVGRGIDDLEARGLVRRFRNARRGGLILVLPQVTDGPPGLLGRDRIEDGI